MFVDLLIDEALDLLRAVIYRAISREEPRRKGRRGLARRLLRSRQTHDESTPETVEEVVIETQPRRGSALPWLIIGAVGVAAGIIVWQRMNASAEAPLIE